MKLNKLILICIFLGTMNSLFSQDSTNNPTACLIADYSFLGNSMDQTGNGYDGVPNNPLLVANRLGAANEAYRFNGSTDHIPLNSNVEIITTSVFSIVVWAKILGQGGGEDQTNPIFIQRGNSASAASVSSLIGLFGDYQGGNGTFMLRSNTPSNPSPIRVDFPAMNDSAWHFYAAVKDSSEIILYIDGVQVGTTPFTDPGVFDDQIDYVELGRHTYSSAVQGSFNGDIDEVQIYDCPLSESDIQSLYEQLTTSIDSEIGLSKWINIYPNPSSDFVNIENLSTTALDVELLTSNGQVLNSYKVRQELRIDISDLAGAIYFLKVHNSKGKIITYPLLKLE